MNNQTIVCCVVALLLGMLLFHMLKGVCGCKLVEGQCVRDRGPSETPRFVEIGAMSDCLINAVGSFPPDSTERERALILMEQCGNCSGICEHLRSNHMLTPADQARCDPFGRLMG